MSKTLPSQIRKNILLALCKHDLCIKNSFPQENRDILKMWNFFASFFFAFFSALQFAYEKCEMQMGHSWPFVPSLPRSRVKKKNMKYDRKKIKKKNFFWQNRDPVVNEGKKLNVHIHMHSYLHTSPCKKCHYIYVRSIWLKKNKLSILVCYL